jgi:hypothetical protein
MTLVYFVFGIWIGMVITYFEWYVPMYKKIKNLEEGMKDCIKSGLISPTTDGSQEKDMD